MSPQRAPKKNNRLLVWLTVIAVLIFVAWLASMNTQISGTDSGATVSPPAAAPLD